MKLMQLLAKLSPEKLLDLGQQLESGESPSPALLVTKLEQIIRSPKHVELTLATRRPPVFPLIQTLLRCDQCSGETEAVREDTLRRHAEISQSVTNGDLLSGHNHELYRRVLKEAWRNDLRLDASEISLLGVLRHEIGVRQVEHYLSAHHAEIEPYWRSQDPFRKVLDELVGAGIVFEMDGFLHIPEDLVPSIRDAIGLHLPLETLSRLLTHLPAQALADILRSRSLKSSGDKQERIERLVENLVSPYEALDRLSLGDLGDLAQSVRCAKSGSKDEVIVRLIDYFREDRDLEEPEAEPQQAVESKELGSDDFRALFGALPGRELSAIIWRVPQARSSGTKSVRIESLWESPFSEASLLKHLGNEGLKSFLQRLGLKTSGSKSERLRRLILEGAAAAVSKQSSTG